MQGARAPPFWNSKEGLQTGPSKNLRACGARGSRCPPPLSTNPGSAPAFCHLELPVSWCNYTVKFWAKFVYNPYDFRCTPVSNLNGWKSVQLTDIPYRLTCMTYPLRLNLFCTMNLLGSLRWRPVYIFRLPTGGSIKNLSHGSASRHLVTIIVDDGHVSFVMASRTLSPVIAHNNRLYLVPVFRST